VPVAVTVVSYIINLLLLWKLVFPHALTFPRDMERSIGDIARYLRENTPSKSLVATPDIGMLGFYSERRIVDLGGLTHPAISRLWHEKGYESMIEDLAFLSIAEADFLVDRNTTPERWANHSARGRVCVPLLTRKISGLGIRQQDEIYYTLYHLKRE
jgi:hypothetical protein